MVFFNPFEDFIKSEVSEDFEEFGKRESLDFLSLGDIVWAKRYKTEEEKMNIPKGHQVGPYIVIKKNDEKIYALSCTSSYKGENQFYLSSRKYQFTKNTYVNLRYVTELDPEQYLVTLRNLTADDLNDLLKNLYFFVKTNGNQDNFYSEEDFKFTLNSGDIFSYYDKLYFVYKTDDLYYYCFESPTNNNHKISINDFKIDHEVVIPKTEPVKLISIGNTKNVANIISRLREIKENEGKLLENKIERGAMVLAHSQLYYIYGEHKLDYLGIKIFIDPVKHSQKISINNQNYWTLYEEQILGNDVDVISYASKSEIDQIKNFRKSLKISKKPKKPVELIFHKIKAKTVVEFEEQRYVVLKRKDNIITVVNINDYSDYFEIDLESLDDIRPIQLFSEIDFYNVLLQLKKYQKGDELKRLLK